MNKHILTAVLAGVLAVSVMGCGNAKKNEEVMKNTTDKVQIRFSTWDGGDTLKAYEEVCKAFNESQENVEVSMLNIPEEYSTKITTMAAGNDVPEICMMSADEILYPMAEEGYIKNMKELIEKDPEYDSSDMLDALKVWNGDDFMVGYASGAEDVCIFYSPTLFQKYGVDMPPADYADAWNWDTFLRNAQLLTIDKNGNNALSPEFDPENIDIYGVHATKWWATWMPFVISNGGNYLTEDGAKFGMESPEVIDAMQKIADLINVYHVMPLPTASETLTNTSSALSTGKVAMVIDGQWQNATLMADDIYYDVAALPKMGEKARSIVTHGVLCVMNTPKADAAWKFFKYISECGAIAPLEKSGLKLPTTKSGLSEEYIKSIITDKHPEHYYDAIVRPLLDGTAAPMPSTSVANFAKINDLFNPVLDKVWSGEETYADAVKSVSEECNKLVAGWNK